MVDDEDIPTAEVEGEGEGMHVDGGDGLDSTLTTPPAAASEPSGASGISGDIADDDNDVTISATEETKDDGIVNVAAEENDPQQAAEEGKVVQQLVDDEGVQDDQPVVSSDDKNPTSESYDAVQHPAFSPREDQVGKISNEPSTAADAEDQPRSTETSAPQVTTVNNQDQLTPSLPCHKRYQGLFIIVLLLINIGLTAALIGVFVSQNNDSGNTSDANKKALGANQTAPSSPVPAPAPTLEQTPVNDLPSSSMQTDATDAASTTAPTASTNATATSTHPTSPHASLSITTISPNNNGSSWMQIGQTIYGEASGDQLGKSISISADGKTLAIGALKNDATDTESGHVKVYHRNADGWSWKQLGQTIHGESSYDFFGTSVSLSSDGKTLAIGAKWGGPLRGQVKVFQLDSVGTSWKQFGQTINDDVADGELGTSVSLSGDGKLLAVGAAGGYYNNNGKPGCVKIYVLEDNREPSWAFGQNITGEGDPIGERDGDVFGWSVSLSTDGRALAIGAPWHVDTDDVNKTGYVKVYHKDDGPTFKQQGQTIYGETLNDRFGWSVSLSANGKILAIGAPENVDINASYKSGQVRVYEWYDTGSVWKQVGEDLNGQLFSDFGYSVDLSAEGKTLAIGAPSMRTKNGSLSGRVVVYVWNNDLLAWTQLDQVIDGETSWDRSGQSVALSSDGKILAIGEPQENDSNGNVPGQVRVFNIVH